MLSYTTLYMLLTGEEMFSMADEKHFVLFIKDIFDKESDFILNRWYADMAK